MDARLAALIALQALDTAADTARRRLAELPVAEQAIDARIAEAAAGVEAAKAALGENQQARRQLEKDVAAVDVRLAKFEDHKAAVKTNEQYTALLHEIATAKLDKDAAEERLLIQMETGDGLTRDVKAAEAALAKTRKDGDATRATLAAERTTVEAEFGRLTGSRKAETTGLDPKSLALYEQLLKGRRGVAVASMTKDTCNACHVRLRPHIAQQVRRNDSIVQCDSCQRILYFAPPPVEAEAQVPNGEHPAAAEAPAAPRRAPRAQRAKDA